jgi:hypothetical protein
MAKLAIVSGHVRTASFPGGFCVVLGTILGDSHEAVVAVPSWFTTVTGSKQATTTGSARRRASRRDSRSGRARSSPQRTRRRRRCRPPSTL